MKGFYFVFALFIICVKADDKPCDKSKCVGEQKLYKELGCTPVTEEGQCCPSRYECPDFTKLDDKKCHYKNEVFAVRSTLAEEVTGPLCSAACYCREHSEYGPAEFNCANVECPELFHREPDCIYQKEKNRCCSVKKVCGDDKKVLSKCYLDGREYYEGEKMYPDSERCHSCFCRKDFDNSTIVGNAHCSEVDCGIQLRYMSNLQKECVPVYYGDNKCCPIEWRCPKNDDKVETKGKNGAESQHKCSFGTLRLNVGEELNNVDTDVTCACVSPPFVQCVKSS